MRINSKVTVALFTACLMCLSSAAWAKSHSQQGKEVGQKVDKAEDKVKEKAHEAEHKAKELADKAKHKMQESHEKAKNGAHRALDKM